MSDTIDQINGKNEQIFFQQLSSEINQFINIIKPRPTEEAMRSYSIAQIQSILESIFNPNEFKLTVFGSHFTTLGMINKL